jgi:methionine sulfoxide reductase heme-binding subunit
MDRANAFARRLPTWVVYCAGALPVFWLAWLVVQGDLGPDPAKTMERDLGEWALRFLLASLAVSPLRRVGLNLLKFRRALGLLAFAYVTLHLTVWVWPDMGLRWSQILADLTKRPYILFGFVGFVVMLPLALTSSNAAIRRMGPLAWRRLHKLAYAALALGTLHLATLARVWTVEVLVYVGLAIVLLAFRLWPARPALRAKTAAQG